MCAWGRQRKDILGQSWTQFHLSVLPGLVQPKAGVICEVPHSAENSPPGRAPAVWVPNSACPQGRRAVPRQSKGCLWCLFFKTPNFSAADLRLAVGMRSRWEQGGLREFLRLPSVPEPQSILWWV